jgi:hypothetical protein
VNLHIYFIFGLGMAAALLVERCWSDPRRRTLMREGA